MLINFYIIIITIHWYFVNLCHFIVVDVSVVNIHISVYRFFSYCAGTAVHCEDVPVGGDSQAGRKPVRGNVHPRRSHGGPRGLNPDFR